MTNYTCGLFFEGISLSTAASVNLDSPACVKNLITEAVHIEYPDSIYP